MAASRAQSGRRQPRQARSRSTVDAILLAAARVFRREGWRATTNRIAAEAGVGVGSLYEYFPDKQALLHALALKHLELAERGLAPALDGRSQPLREWLATVQAAVLASQQFPSQALELLSGGARGQLRARGAAARACARQPAAPATATRPGRAARAPARAGRAGSHRRAHGPGLAPAGRAAVAALCGPAADGDPPL